MRAAQPMPVQYSRMSHVARGQRHNHGELMGAHADSSQDGSELESDESLDIEHLDPKDVTEIKVPESSYGAMMIGCTRPFADKEGKEDNSTELKVVAATQIMVHLFTMSVQFGFTLLLLVTSIEHKEDPFETSSELAFETGLMTNAVLANTRLNTTIAVQQKVQDLCYKDETMKHMHFFIILIWFTKMVPEVTASLWSFRVMLNLHMSDKTVTMPRRGGKKVVVAVTARARALMLISCPCLQLTMALICGWAGAKLLALRNSSLELVARMVVMTFIVELDEMLYAACTSLYVQQHVQSTSFAIRRHKSRFDNFLKDHIGPIKFLLTLLLTYIFYEVIFGNVATFRSACYEYRHVFPKPTWAEHFGIAILRDIDMA